MVQQIGADPGFNSLCGRFSSRFEAKNFLKWPFFIERLFRSFRGCGYKNRFESLIDGMSAYDRILLPTDGSSEGSQTSLRHAMTQAQAFDAVLHILYVSDSGPVGESSVYMGEKSPGAKGAVKSVEQEAKRYGVETEADVVHGDPVDEIVDYAESRAMDMIIMGTHARTGISRVLEGSVTEEVIRTSNKPVLAVERQD